VIKDVTVTSHVHLAREGRGVGLLAGLPRNRHIRVYFQPSELNGTMEA